MGKIIEFYVPLKFPKNLKWTPQSQRGKLIEFPRRMTSHA
jgi:hypothetical protein